MTPSRTATAAWRRLRPGPPHDPPFALRGGVVIWAAPSSASWSVGRMVTGSPSSPEENPDYAELVRGQVGKGHRQPGGLLPYQGLPLSYDRTSRRTRSPVRFLRHAEAVGGLAPMWRARVAQERMWEAAEGGYSHAQTWRTTWSQRAFLPGSPPAAATAVRACIERGIPLSASRSRLPGISTLVQSVSFPYIALDACASGGRRGRAARRPR
jgi:argininosuccinate lyase